MLKPIPYWYCYIPVSSDEKKSISCLRHTGIKYPLNETFLVNVFDKFHRVPTKPGADRIPKGTERQKRLINLQQVPNDTLSRSFCSF